MKKTLTSTQANYLQTRGFKVIQGPPPQDEPFPYLTLREPQQWVEESEITYHLTRSSTQGFLDVAHPSSKNKGKLVDMIRKTVAGSMHLDGELFTTKSGKPIKVYVIDSAWNEVVEALVANQ